MKLKPRLKHSSCERRTIGNFCRRTREQTRESPCRLGGKDGETRCNVAIGGFDVYERDSDGCGDTDRWSF